MKMILLLAAVLLAGCSGHYTVTVYGHSGVPYTAPTLCAALVQCLNAPAETSCLYDKTIVTSGSTTEETGCKEIKK